MTPVIIVSGPTCAGKTELALSLAAANNAEIISCDSVQIYRGMDIGSAKPTAAERAKIPHHLIDVADVRQTFDVAQYVSLAKAALADIGRRGKNVVVVGGSGFYLKSWFAATADSVAIPPEAAQFAALTEAERGAEGLAAELLKIDPDAAQTVDIHNPRRTRKALERCLATGKSAAELRADFAKLPCPMGEFERRFILLDRPDAELAERIKARSRAMLAAGLVEETRALMQNGLLQNPPLRNSTGYKQAIEFIQSGSADLEKLEREISAQTMSLARKQRKYFRTQLGDIPRCPPPQTA